MLAAIKSFFHAALYQPLYNLLIFFAWLVPGHSMGWAIIILTIIIRLVLLPSSIKAAKAQVKLQALQPKMNEIRKKYTDQAEQSRALMALYKEEGTSPFGSCLPQLIQLPILWILYQVFRNGLDASRFSLLYSFTPHPETINNLFYGLNLSHPEKWVLPILAGGTQLILSLMMQPKQVKQATSDSSDPTQMMMKQMTFIMPVMTLLLARSFPAALSIYWVITTLFSIGQQWYVNTNIKKETASKMPDSETATQEAKKPAIEEKPSDAPKKDFLTKLNERRMDKAEKKGDVTVSIRKKERK